MRKRSCKAIERQLKKTLDNGDLKRTDEILSGLSKADFDALSVYMRRRISGLCMTEAGRGFSAESLLLQGSFVKEDRMWQKVLPLNAEKVTFLIRGCRPDLVMTQALLEMAENDPECLALLLHYKEGHFCAGSLSHREDVVFEKEIGLGDLTAKDLRKDFLFRGAKEGVSLYRYIGKEHIVPVPESYKGCPLREIAKGAFEGTDVSQVILPEGIYLIRDNAFKDCSGLETVILPETVKAIGAGAFEGCQHLNSLQLPDSLETVGGRLFSETKKYLNMYRPSGYEAAGNMMAVICSSSVFELLDFADRMSAARAYLVGLDTVTGEMEQTTRAFICGSWLRVYETILDEDWQTGLSALFHKCPPDNAELEAAWDIALERFGASDDYYDVTVRTLMGVMSPLISYVFQDDHLWQLSGDYTDEFLLLYLATDFNFGDRIPGAEQMIRDRRDGLKDAVLRYEGQEIADRMRLALDKIVAGCI